MRFTLTLLISLSSFVCPCRLAAQNAEPYSGVSAKMFQGLEWHSIGPNRGGRSLTSTGSPGRKNEYYFGATGGGLWKTVDSGTTWKPVTDGQISSSSVGAVAVAQTNPDVVYIGMGEVDLRGSITQGDGVYKSKDGGKTWHSMGLRDTQAIARIRVHPSDPDLVYVAALGHPYGANDERGVFRSKDGGENWERILFVSSRAGAVDLVIDPRDPRVLYASIWQVYRKAWKMWGGGPDSGLYKSVDGGDNWHQISKNPGMPDGPLGRIGVTVSPADPQRLWAIVEANEGGVFRSDDGGATWERTNAERKLRQRSFYYSRIYADPLDHDVVYCLNTGLYKSTDGGVLFDTTIRVPHGDNHDLWIDPNDPQRMINSNDGGANVSINGGETWTEQDFPTAQLYHVMATNDYPYHVAGAQQDNSTVAVPSKGWGHLQARGPNHGYYYSVGGGESGWITQHPSKLDIFYSGSQGALLTRYNRRTGQIRDIQVYPRFFSGEPASALPERWQWTFPIMFSPLDERVMYTCSQHLWKTIDDGQSWQRISPDLTAAEPETLGKTGGVITMDMNGPEIYATIFALAPSFHDTGTIWTGSDDGLLHITRDGGESWQNITPPDMPKYSRVSMIDESRHHAGTAYVAANRYQVDDRAPYVWRTTDYGQTWTKIIAGIADGHFARVVREDHVRPGLLFLGTEHGVYVSLDAGDHWQPMQLNLPDTPVRDLVVKDSDVVLGTHGRGFWILHDIGPLREFSPEVASAKLHLFEVEDAVRGLGNAIVHYSLTDRVERVKVEIFDDQGQQLRSFEGTEPEPKKEHQRAGRFGREPGKPTTRDGLNRFEWDLHYKGATTFDGMIIWSARPQRGPMAPPGRYRVRISAAGEIAERWFEVGMDPRLEGVAEADLREQFDLAMQIRNRTSEANEAVIEIRATVEQVEARLATEVGKGLRKDAESLLAELKQVETALYQVKNRSGQDPLNFPIKLNNRLASLRRSVERGEARPTEASYQVFKELSGELDVQMERLQGVSTGALATFNESLKVAGLDQVMMVQK